MSKIRCVVVTNVPVPYRLRAWDLVADSNEVDLHVIYCAGAHIDVTADGRSQRYGVHFLKANYKAYDTRFSHADAAIFKLLDEIKPDVVVTTGFIPTYLFAFAWSVLRRVRHVAMTDGTFDSELSLSWVHKLVRRVVFARTSAFIGACRASLKLYASYGVKPERMHLSPLCTLNEAFDSLPVEKRYDLLFCGRFLQLKNPLFALDVAHAVALKLGRRVSLRFVGHGTLQPRMVEHAATMSDHVETTFAGYLSQQALPAEYAASRLFLFPTAMDCWGVVLNEACAAGVPCISSPHTGAAGELILDGVNGHVCPLELAPWVDRCVALLANEALWQSFSKAARQQVQHFTFEHAATGFVSAVSQAASASL